jgi:hypothetical protein
LKAELCLHEVPNRCSQSAGKKDTHLSIRGPGKSSHSYPQCCSNQNGKCKEAHDSGGCRHVENQIVGTIHVAPTKAIPIDNSSVLGSSRALRPHGLKVRGSAIASSRHPASTGLTAKDGFSVLGGCIPIGPSSFEPAVPRKMAAPFSFQIVGRIWWMIPIFFVLCKLDCRYEPNNCRDLEMPPWRLGNLGQEFTQA